MITSGCGDDAGLPDRPPDASPSGTTMPTADPPSTPATEPSTTSSPTAPTDTAGSVPAVPRPPGFLTPEDAGTYAIAVGERTSLRLEDGRVWSEPVLDGDAVELVPVDFESNPGYDQWDIVALHPGQSTVSVESGGETFEFRFIVI